MTISNGAKLYLNGNQIGSTSSNSPFSPKVLGGNFALGSTTSNTLQADSIFDEVEIWKDVYTAGEVKADFNRNRAHGLERSYFSALELLIPEFAPEIIRGTDYYTFVLEALEVIS